jgi:membrane protease YdiL (CAAX protease family)
MESEAAPKDLSAAEAASINGHASRGCRSLWLLIICLAAFTYPFINSTLYFLFGSGLRPRSSSTEALTFWFYVGITLELAALAVLVYGLRRQGRSLRQLTLSFSWKDLPESLLLTLGSYLVFAQIYGLIFYIYYAATRQMLNTQPQNVEFLKTKITVAAILLMVVNPFYEELIARAYLITEVQFLTGNRVMALVASVVLQTSYHLYQGALSAAMLAVPFTIFSLYFIMRRRILPVILAHMYFDFIALLSHAKY